MVSTERRLARRLPVGFYLTRLVNNAPEHCFTTCLSVTGAYVEHVAELSAKLPEVVQIELPLPGESDTLWARGEVVRESPGPLFQGSGVRFTAMASRHRRWLAEWLRERRRALYAPDGEVVHDGAVAIIRP